MFNFGVTGMPLVPARDVDLTDEQKAKLQKGIADIYKEVSPVVKVHEEFR